MQATGRAVSPDQDARKSASAALAFACKWLRVGNLAEASKWAAIAARLGEAENPIKTN